MQVHGRYAHSLIHNLILKIETRMYSITRSFNKQEQLAFRLILSQVAYAIGMQKYNGTFILYKYPTSFEKFKEQVDKFKKIEDDDSKHLKFIMNEKLDVETFSFLTMDEEDQSSLIH